MWGIDSLIIIHDVYADGYFQKVEDITASRGIYFFRIFDNIPIGYNFIAMTLQDSSADLDSVNYSIINNNFYAYPSVVIHNGSASEEFFKSIKARIVYAKV